MRTMNEGKILFWSVLSRAASEKTHEGEQSDVFIAVKIWPSLADTSKMSVGMEAQMIKSVKYRIQIAFDGYKQSQWCPAIWSTSVQVTSAISEGVVHTAIKNSKDEWPILDDYQPREMKEGDLASVEVIEKAVKISTDGTVVLNVELKTEKYEVLTGVIANPSGTLAGIMRLQDFHDKVVEASIVWSKIDQTQSDRAASSRPSRPSAEERLKTVRDWLNLNRPKSCNWVRIPKESFIRLGIPDRAVYATATGVRRGKHRTVPQGDDPATEASVTADEADPSSPSQSDMEAWGL